MADYHKTDIFISDYKRLIRELNKLEPELVKEMRGGIREVAEVVRSGVRAAIPSRAPIRGMVRKLSFEGKTWNTNTRARTVKVSIRSPKRDARKNQAIAQLIINSPATIIADMAQKSGRNNGKMTDWYVYPRSETTSENYRPGERRHKINGQGAGLLKALDKHIGAGDKSRMVYPGAEKKLDAAAARLAEVVGDAAEKAERKLDG